MGIKRAAIGEILIIHEQPHADERGWLSETYRTTRLAEFGVDCRWNQENLVFTKRRGTLRGLHFQAPPHAQAKLLRVLKGEVFDVAVDLRMNAPTFGRHVAMRLSADQGPQIYVPAGFAHGYCTLTDNVEFLYKCSAEYAPVSEAGLMWNDPALEIDWPFDSARMIVNTRDAAWPRLAELKSPF